MRKALLPFLVILSLGLNSCKDESAEPAQDSTLYFPPNNSSVWETATIQELGWNAAAVPPLLDYLENNNTRAFILLKDGKIVMEHYFGKSANGTPFTTTSNWYWASAGKTLTAFMVGKAQEDGLLTIQDKTSTYLGNGWSSLSTAQEDKITLRHQLTMTTGLNDGVPDNHCSDPGCLTYLAPAGTRWAYHNGPYNLLTDVVAAAAGKTFNSYFDSQLKNKTGMDGSWTTIGNDYVYISTARSMARFGLLMLNKGKWGTTTVLNDQAYITAMLSPSQNLNQSYGYLWWLNGKASYMLPTLQRTFSGSIAPDAPTDMVAAIGKNGQLINIVPSQNLVLIRMGENPDNADVSLEFQNELWKKINPIIQ
ncbi:serine hydrolase domain-containing protein [Pontibacter fetidus]|uniref:Beta-lactamase family protein n=1 Tax=Pontibacter fetidus TaxID=2700082 RepID=A0A6B2GYA6_9BACT|nr:serine hydrolase domain-containing protein [Pontibacter fetidus]NDK54848.1 beta-lactamase family protein [Pontibacter fetidus]